jgi:hypothetical protein
MRLSLTDNSSSKTWPADLNTSSTRWRTWTSRCPRPTSLTSSWSKMPLIFATRNLFRWRITNPWSRYGRTPACRRHGNGVTRQRYQKSTCSLPSPYLLDVIIVSQPVILLFVAGQLIWSYVHAIGTGYHPMQSPNHRYYGDDVQPTGTRDANGGCGWPEERTAEMDTLFPRCD